jgi:hypothetical protein
VPGERRRTRDVWGSRLETLDAQPGVRWRIYAQAGLLGDSGRVNDERSPMPPGKAMKLRVVYDLGLEGQGLASKTADGKKWEDINPYCG